MSFFESIFSRFFSSILAGFIERKSNPMPNLDGSWVYEQTTTQSAYNPYVKMRLRYLALLAVDGNKISGSSEKIWEYSVAEKEREYVGRNRSTADISGHIKRKLFSRNVLVIHLSEDGHGRKYSTQHIVEVIDQNLLSGRFSSTAADQVGTCKWERRTT